MLILSRQLNEKIVIGSDVVVTVLAIKGNRVRLGVKAPEDVCVDRLEIREMRDADSAGNCCSITARLAT